MTRAATKTRKATASPATLVSLGAPRLAELLAAAAKADRALGRALSLELSAHRGDLAEEIDRQIARLGAGKGRLDARRAGDLARELLGLQSAILQTLAVRDASAALTRLFDLVRTAPSILARRSYEADVLVEAYRSAVEAIPALLREVPPSGGQEAFASLAYRLYLEDDAGLAVTLFSGAAAALGPEGRVALRSTVQRDLDALLSGPKRPLPARRPLWRLTQALEDLADIEDDVEGFVAAEQLRGPGASQVKIAARLLSAKRLPEAMAALDAAKPGAAQTSAAIQTLRIEVLDALGRNQEAQDARWRQFQTDLSAPMLKAYLKRLADFDDVQEEAAALDWVLEHPNATLALSFLADWPDRRRAASLVRARYTSLDGEDVAMLAPAAEMLAHIDPLAATLIYRLMISHTLRWRRKARFAEAARQLDGCAGLALAVTDWDRWSPHEAYVRKLRLDNPRNPKFWNRIAVNS